MSKTCIVTGGAGFIGSALSAGLVQRFDRVIAFDNLLAQVHGDTPRPPELDPAVELYRADVREAQAWTALLDTVDAVDTVIDLAAETGTGQSLFSATRHTSVNVVGTSRMMDALAQTGKLPRQLLLTSSRAIYGEGAWRSAEGEIFYPGQRTDAQLAAGQKPELWTLLLGNHGGCIGETCALALLLGGAYLLIRGVITWQTPVCFVGTVFVLSLILGQDAVRQILSGGLLLGAFFMATDYVTTPQTCWGRALFGIGAGLLTCLIRFYGSYAEGVSFAILFMNILTPYLSKWTRSKPLGGVPA